VDTRAVALAADGIDAWHVRDRGLEGTTDHELLDRAYEEDRILVTLNVGDFPRDEQIELVREIAATISDCFRRRRPFSRSTDLLPDHLYSCGRNIPM